MFRMKLHRRLHAIFAFPAALAGVYLLAGLVVGTVPVNAGRVPPAAGVRIYVEDNGIHTGIVMPVSAAGVDWRGRLRSEHLRDPRYAAFGWRSFGWGDRAFYIGTPTWGDLRLATVGAAAIGSSSTVIHVEAVPEPRPGRDVRALVLSVAEYRRLAAFVAAPFRGPGRPVFGYGGGDAVYPARGRYSAVTTCNAWTGAALRPAGGTMGAWTRFPVTVMRWLPVG